MFPPVDEGSAEPTDCRCVIFHFFFKPRSKPIQRQYTRVLIPDHYHFKILFCYVVCGIQSGITATIEKRPDGGIARACGPLRQGKIQQL
jgi:hypothetical protein